VARWLLDYETSMTSRLAEGSIITIAPDYSHHKRLTPLPAAQAEADMLATRFNAVRLPGKRDALMNVLKGEYPSPVSLLHFAGHGEYSGSPVTPSVIHLEDNEELRTLEVRTSQTSLGRRSRPLVLFNACEAGSATDVLGGMAGWAEAFIRGRFAGFLAPLWPVQDDHALRVVEQLVKDLVDEHLTVGEALRAMREREAQVSPTYLAYVYVGDVMARIGPTVASASTSSDARRSAVG
jgi:CHAT domain-containing protein